MLSNGIFTTGSGNGSERYANVEYIPLKGAQMEKIAEINQLSRDIAADKYTLREARLKVEEIRRKPAKPFWEQLLGSAFGSAGFCILFGGGWLDSAAARPHPPHHAARRSLGNSRHRPCSCAASSIPGSACQASDGRRRNRRTAS